MHLHTLRIFSDVVRARSFSRGAAAIGVSQSAASQAVHQLEAHLGVKLIDRSKRPLLLTSAGALFYRGCKGLLERYDTLTDEVRVLDVAEAGVVRVAAIYSVVLHHVPAVQKRFAAQHPDAELRIECLPPARVYRAVREDQADLGLLSYLNSLFDDARSFFSKVSPGRRAQAARALRDPSFFAAVRQEES